MQIPNRTILMKNHILLIEDSPTQALQTAGIMESAGYEVIVASTGRYGLEKAQKKYPDIIVLDVVLPDIDGYSVCRRLRKELSTYIPILMLTGLNDMQDKVDGLEVGADDYLTKPFDGRELLARVLALLRTKSIQDELKRRLEQEQRSYQELKKIALTDHLTGLYNRHYLVDVLQREFDIAKRYNTPLSCTMVDIDHFRNFNNQYGHAIGDRVLQGVASVLKENVRDVDVVARYGGEEFILLQPKCDANSSDIMAERMRGLVEAQSWDSAAGPLKTTISLGVVSFPFVCVKSAEDIIDCADRALYQAKEHGRNRVVMFRNNNGGKEVQ